MSAGISRQAGHIYFDHSFVDADKTMTAKTDQIYSQLQQHLQAKGEAHLVCAGAKEVSPMATGPLLQELHVHQIELEMQNEELRRAYAELEESRDRYTDLFDFAPAGYITLDAEDLIVECNLTAAALLGVERQKLIKRRFAQLIADEDKDNWYLQCRHGMQQRSKYSCELIMQRHGGAHFHANLDCLYIEADDAAPLLRITLTDITARKQAEEALRIAAVAFETQEGIIVTDSSKTILRANKAFSRMTGYSSEEIIGKTPTFLQSGLYGKAFYQAMWTSIARNGYWQGEIWDKRQNGEVFPLLLNITEVTGAEGRITNYVGCFTDITVQKQAEEVMQNVRRRLENQVQKTLMELEKSKEETSEVNTAFGVLLKQQNEALSAAQSALSHEAERTVLPFLKRLKGVARGKNEIRLIDIVETNLKQLLEVYGSSASLSAAYQKLTPVELQVAALVRRGLPTKTIAATLNLSPGTVSIHRKHIRKKFGLDNKSCNLESYLKSLAEDAHPQQLYI